VGDLQWGIVNTLSVITTLQHILLILSGERDDCVLLVWWLLGWLWKSRQPCFHVQQGFVVKLHRLYVVLALLRHLHSCMHCSGNVRCAGLRALDFCCVRLSLSHASSHHAGGFSHVVERDWIRRNLCRTIIKKSSWTELTRMIQTLKVDAILMYVYISYCFSTMLTSWYCVMTEDVSYIHNLEVTLNH